MPDEACTTYSSIVDEYTLGHSFLYSTFGTRPSKVSTSLQIIPHTNNRDGNLIPLGPAPQLQLLESLRDLMYK